MDARIGSVSTVASTSRLAYMRHGVATLLLGLSIVVSVLATRYVGVLTVSELTIWVLLAFFVAMLPESINELRKMARLRLTRIAGVAVLFCATSWVFHQGVQLNSIRMLAPLVWFLFFVSAVAWFRHDAGRRIAVVFWLKLSLTALALLVLSVVLWQGVSTREIFVSPPIYRHLRHANYDLAMVIGLALWFFHRVGGRFHWPAVAGFALLGYFSFWSGGRGEFLALLVMALMLVTLGKVSVRSPVFLVPALSLLAGGVLVLVSGQGDLLLDRIGRSVNGTADAISSGRVRIWTVAMERVLESPYSALFGFGPDAFVRLGIYRDVWPGQSQYIVHPHNTLVQWALDFGMVGVAVLIGVVVRVAQVAFGFIAEPGIGPEKAASIMVLGMLVFGLVDGVYYHAAPLAFMVLIWAYLYACRARTMSNGTLDRRQSGDKDRT